MKKIRWSYIQIEDTFNIAYIAIMISIVIIPLSVATVKALLRVNLSLTFLYLLYSLIVRNYNSGKFTHTIIKKMTIFEIALSISTLRYIIINNDSLDDYLFTNFSIIFLYRTSGFYVGIDAFLELIIILMFLIYVKIILRKVINTSVKFDIDSLPGKLMSIEADYNNEKISVEEAQMQKEEMQQAVYYSGKREHAVIFMESAVFIFIYTVILKTISSILIGVLLNGISLIDSFLLYSKIIYEDTFVLSLPIIFNFASLYIQLIRKYKQEDVYAKNCI